MRQIIFSAFLVLTTVDSTNFISSSHVSPVNLLNHRLKTKPLGVSVVLYRVGKAEKIDDLSGLETQMGKSRSVTLYGLSEDVGIVLMNKTDPYGDTTTLPYKMLYGSFVEKQVGYKLIGGFIPTAEVATICDWIKRHKIDSYEGFSKMYDGLSKEAKQELEDVDAEDKDSLFRGYIQPLTQFYFAALKDKNSIVICGE